MSDANEVERLRARIEELESQLTRDNPPEEKPPGRQSPWWAVGAAVLVTLACVLAPLAVTSVWADRVLSDTDQYVETVAPLADDPAVQKALATRVTQTVLQYVDVEGVTTELLDTLAQQDNVPPRLAAALPALATPITNGVESFTRTQVNNFMASPQFAALWTQVNRIAHEQVVKLLEGNQGGAVSAQDNTITVNLGPIVAQVKQRLVAQGFTLANNIPAVDTSFVLVQSDAITSAQGFYQLLNTLGLWLPVIALVLLAGGVLLARDRRRALLRGALGLTASMLLLGVGLAIARTWYVETTPADILTGQAAGGVFDTFVRFLRTSLRAVAVLGLVVAVGAFLTGPGSASVRTRESLERGNRFAAGRRGASRLADGPGRDLDLRPQACTQDRCPRRRRPAPGVLDQAHRVGGGGPRPPGRPLSCGDRVPRPAPRPARARPAHRGRAAGDSCGAPADCPGLGRGPGERRPARDRGAPPVTGS